MPLQQGGSDQAVSSNIRELIQSGRPPDQAKAIAYRVAGRPKKVGVAKQKKDVKVKGKGK